MPSKHSRQPAMISSLRQYAGCRGSLVAQELLCGGLARRHTCRTRVKHTRWCLVGSPKWKVRVTSVVPQLYWPPATAEPLYEAVPVIFLQKATLTAVSAVVQDALA